MRYLLSLAAVFALVACGGDRERTPGTSGRGACPSCMTIADICEACPRAQDPLKNTTDCVDRLGGESRVCWQTCTSTDAAGREAGAVAISNEANYEADARLALAYGENWPLPCGQ